MLKIPIFYKLAGFPQLSLPQKAKFSIISIINIVEYHFFLGILKKMIQRSDYVQALNPVIKIALIRNFKIPETRVLLIPNSIQCDEFRDFYHPGLNTFGYVGRLDAIKNLLALIKAFKSFHNHFPNFRLAIFGEGQELGTLQKAVKDLELEKAVTFYGFQKDPLQIYTKFDYFILPSFSEGISNSLLEAMAVGMPILVSNIPGNKFLVDDGKEGLTFDPQDINDMVQKMERIITDTKLREHIRINASRKVRSLFDTDTVVKKMLAIMRIAKKHN
ncbi:MAG: glycosyltransferase family 4 protein [Candidatus Sigynarchaeota archaeon]